MVFFVRVRAILDVAVDAHVPLGRVEVRAAVLHDGAVDLFLHCTSLLDDDNVVLAGCDELVRRSGSLPSCMGPNARLFFQCSNDSARRAMDERRLLLSTEPRHVRI